jgi:glycosyltransferase involved in cell wall biosynthesis
VVFDFDDALWTRPIKPYSFMTQWRVNHRLKFWLQHASHTFVANHYLATYARTRSDKVSVLPMTLDLQVWKKGEQEEGLIGWCGAPHNFHYLEKMQDELLRVKSDFPHVRFAVYSGKKPSLKIPFDYVPFKKGEEHLFVQKLQIGLLPLDQDPYSLGKSPIKALQYMACGVPIVSTAKGASLELLQGNCVSACTDLLSNPQKRVSLGEAGRALAEKNHDQKKVAAQFLEQLMEIAGSKD